jgi:hypothetical protein
MAQSAKRHLPVDEAHRLRFKRAAEIKGFIERFLDWYTTAEGPQHQPPKGTSKSPRLTVNDGDLIDSTKRTVDARERAETIPNELSVFTTVEGAGLLAEHDAGEGPRGDSAGTDVGLQWMEAATSAHIGLRRSKRYKILTHPRVDTEERTKIMFRPDDMSQIAVSAKQSDPIFAGLKGHQEEGEMSLGGTDGHLEVSPTPGEPDTLFSGSNLMDTGSDMELTRDLLQ